MPALQYNFGMKDKVGLLSGIAGIITALAALFAVFMSDAGDRADKADNKSDAAYELLKQQAAYTEKDISLIRTSQGKQADAVNDLSQQVAIIKMQMEMIARMRREPLPQAPSITPPAVKEVSAPAVQKEQRPELPASLEEAL